MGHRLTAIIAHPANAEPSTIGLKSIFQQLNIWKSVSVCACVKDYASERINCALTFFEGPLFLLPFGRPLGLFGTGDPLDS